MPLSLPRPKVLLLLSAAIFAFFSLTALLHPSSPVVVSSASNWLSDLKSSATYSRYPPNLPYKQGGGFAAAGGNSSSEGGYENDKRHANATFVVLARNSEVQSVIESMQMLEDRFNWWAGYDWVFLNDEPFDDNFKRLTGEMASTKCQYGQIDAKDWNQPDSIDEDKAKASRDDMVSKNVIYGDSVPYRNMCRYNSGFFFRHPLLMPYRYYWRMEPSVKFYCDILYDPFLVMEDEKKVYGFTLSLYEFQETIMTLWDATKEFMKLHPEHLAEDNSMEFLSDDGGETYNRCHFWSNFEIGDLDFWRGDAYMDYFNFLEEKGGFYYERWGDAPVHSIGASLFAHKDQIKFFSDIGYYHGPYQHCPVGDAHSIGRCSCKEADNFDSNWYSCTNKWKAIHKGQSWFGSPP